MIAFKAFRRNAVRQIGTCAVSKPQMYICRKH